MKFQKTIYNASKEILKYSNHYIAVPVTVDSADIIADENGKKVVPAGTIVGGKARPVLLNRQEPVALKNTAESEGVLLSDVEVTCGDAQGAMIIHGVVDLLKLPTAPSTEAVAALKTITFMN